MCKAVCIYYPIKSSNKPKKVKYHYYPSLEMNKLRLREVKKCPVEGHTNARAWTPKTTLKQTPRGFNTLVIAFVREYLVNSGIKRKYFLTFAIVKELQKKKICLFICLPQ